MHRTHRRPALLAATAAIALFASACGNTKAAQCEKLIDAINEGVALAEDFEQKNKEFFASQPQNPTEAAKVVNDAAGVVDTLVADLKNVGSELSEMELKDEQLVQYRDDYSKNLTEFSGGLEKGTSALRDMGTILTSISDVKPGDITQDKAKQLTDDIRAAESNIQAAGKTSQTAGNEVDKIAKEINTYCGRETPAEGGDDGESGGDSGEGGDTAE